MKPSTVRNKIIQEIKLIPDHKLSELYHVIHSLRLQPDSPRKKIEKIMAFAGCWEDMSEEEFDQFSLEITERRKIALERRQRLEAGNG